MKSLMKKMLLMLALTFSITILYGCVSTDEINTSNNADEEVVEENSLVDEN